MTAFIVAHRGEFGVEPHAWLASVLERIVVGHPESRIDELMLWVAPDA